MNAGERKRGFYEDAEVLELLSDEPDLLAIADAIAETQALRQRRRPRPTLLAAAALLLAVVTTGTLALWPANSSGLIDRALAAVSGAPVLHARFEQVRQNEVTLNLATGVEVPTRINVETWFDERHGQLRSRVVRNGFLVADVVRPAAVSRPPADRAVLEFTSGYRAALENGRVRLVPRGGAAISKIIVEVSPRHREEVTLDPRTNKPAQIASPSGTWRVQLIVAQPRREQDFVPTSTSQAPVRGEVRASEPLSARTITSTRIPWPGRAFVGFTLSQAYDDRLSATFANGAQRPGTGIRLIYRRDAAPRDTIVIQIATRPEPAYGFTEGRLTVSFNPIPPSTELSLVRVGSPPDASWVGQFEQAGSFISIRGRNKGSVIAAARATRA